MHLRYPIRIDSFAVLFSAVNGNQKVKSVEKLSIRENNIISDPSTIVLYFHCRIRSQCLAVFLSVYASVNSVLHNGYCLVLALFLH